METRTDEMNSSRSFEERVFLRFDAIDNRFDALEVRVVNLESKQYDTRPIWELALAQISETNQAMLDGFAELCGQITTTREELRSEIATTREELRGEIAGTREEMHAGFSELRTEIAACATKEEMAAGFTEMRRELDFGLRKLSHKFDALNQNILELWGDHRYVDARLEKVEAHLKLSS